MFLNFLERKLEKQTRVIGKVKDVENNDKYNIIIIKSFIYSISKIIKGLKLIAGERHV